MRKPVNDMVSKDVIENLKKRGVKLNYQRDGKSKKEKYSRDKFLSFYRGYNFLEYLIVVRPYIQKRYNISLTLLEILLYLSARQFFTQADYAKMPKRFTYQSLKNLLDTGFFARVQAGENVGRDVYTINAKGLAIVIHFYECLSGEKKIPDSYSNPLTRSTATNFDKKKMQLIREINLLEVPDSKKKLFQ